MTYEYECAGCGARFDVSASFSEKAAGISPVCPKCGSKETAQVFVSINAFRLTGSGKSGAGRPAGCDPGCGCCG